ncbi:hypothetical protein Hanom_Chr03g00208421 [Helianthus anomalus]
MAETSAYKRESHTSTMVLILISDSNRGRRPFTLRLRVLFLCRFQSRSYLPEWNLDLPPTILLFFNNWHPSWGCATYNRNFGSSVPVPKLTSLLWPESIFFLKIFLRVHYLPLALQLHQG